MIYYIDKLRALSLGVILSGWAAYLLSLARMGTNYMGFLLLGVFVIWWWLAGMHPGFLWHRWFLDLSTASIPKRFTAEIRNALRGGAIPADLNTMAAATREMERWNSRYIQWGAITIIIMIINIGIVRNNHLPQNYLISLYQVGAGGVVQMFVGVRIFFRARTVKKVQRSL